MSDGSGIGWLHLPGFVPATWNPLVGCQKKSAGCARCYAMRTVWMRAHNAKLAPKFEGLVEKVEGKLRWTGKVRFWEPALTIPLLAKRGRAYFVDELSDVFYERVKTSDIDRIFAVIGLCLAMQLPHRFILLTKRPGRMATYLSDPKTAPRIRRVMRELAANFNQLGAATIEMPDFPWANLMPGFSAEDQASFDLRRASIIELDQLGWKIVASLEPLQGPVELAAAQHLSWVLAGGESGTRGQVTRCRMSWLQLIADRCKTAGVPLFTKQLGSLAMDDRGSTAMPFDTKDRKGADPTQWPVALRTQQFPELPPIGARRAA